MKLNIMPLEERIVLDAAGAYTPDAPDAVEEQQPESLWVEADDAADNAIDNDSVDADTDAAENAAEDSNQDDSDNVEDQVQVLAINTAVAGAEELASATIDDVITVLFDGHESTPESILAQITQSLDGRQADSIGFATHSQGAGSFTLADGFSVGQDSLFADARITAFWEGIGALLDNDGRIDLLACNLAATEQGLGLVSDLELLTGHDVAASDDATGNVSYGDWILETDGINIGEVYFTSELLMKYEGRLATTWYVDSTADIWNNLDSDVGLSWDLAYQKLADLLVARRYDEDITDQTPGDLKLQDGDEIWVAAGIYTPEYYALNIGYYDEFYNFTQTTEDFVDDADHQQVTFEMIANVDIYGGFNGTETDRDDRDWDTNVTILSGEVNNISEVNDNLFHVVLGASGSRLDGFTVTKGYAEITYDADGAQEIPNSELGGGMYNTGANDLVIANCTFTTNRAVNGGAMYNNGGSITIEDSFFGDPNTADATDESNIAEDVRDEDNYTEDDTGLGGAMFNNGTELTIRTTIFDTNTSVIHGGAMFNDGGTGGFLTDVYFLNNTANFAAGGSWETPTPEDRGSGGGMYNNGIGADDNLILVNNVFQNNTAYNGGGMYNFESSPHLISTVFDQNTATISGGGLYNNASYTDNSDAGLPGAYITNVIFYQNTAGIDGGGMYNKLCVSDEIDHVLTVVNSNFFENSAGRDGGAIYNGRGSEVTVVNSIFLGNTATVDGDHIINTDGFEDAGDEPSYMTISNSIIDGGGVTGGGIVNEYHEYGGAEPLPAGYPTIDGGDNLDIAPGFIYIQEGYAAGEEGTGPDGTWFTADDGFRLIKYANAEDMGDTAALPEDFADLNLNGVTVDDLETDDVNEGEPIPFDALGSRRIRNGIVDIGAYERSYIIFVDKDGDNSDGETWVTSYNNLQDAMVEAERRVELGERFDEIWVADGIYNPTETDLLGYAADDREVAFDIAPGVYIYGGFSGKQISATETDPLDREFARRWANPETYLTILTGDLSGDDQSVEDDPDRDSLSDNSYHIITAVADGIVTTNLTSTVSADDFGQGVAVQSDGKIVVAGYAVVDTDTVETDFAIMRYHIDGSLDASFGDAGTGIVIVDISGNNDNDYAYGVAIDSDGDITVVGYTVNAGDNDFAMVSLDSSGELNTSFGTDGIQTTDKTSLLDGDKAFAVTIDDNDNILIAGHVSAAGSNRFALLRYDYLGNLDTLNFGTAGMVTFFAAEEAFGIEVMDDGTIVAVGNDAADSILIRYDDTGTLLGSTVTDFGGAADKAYGLEIYWDDANSDSIVDAGEEYFLVAGTDGTDFVIAKYDSTGVLDTSFDTDGLAVATFASGNSEAQSLTTHWVDADEDGSVDAGEIKIVAAGSVITAGGDKDFAMASFNLNDGSVDTDFGANGQLTTSFDPAISGVEYDDTAFGIVSVHRDYNGDGIVDLGEETLVVVGAAHTDGYANIALASYDSDGSFETTFEDNRGATFDGFRIIGGNAAMLEQTSAEWFEKGGAVYVGDFENLRLSTNTFVDNHAVYGGAIYVRETFSTPIYDFSNLSYDSLVSINIWGEDLDDAFSDLVNVYVVNSTFSSNEADEYGGAISASSGSVYVSGSIFSGNEAKTGGAISNYSDTEGGYLVIENSVFTGNTAFAGGALEIGEIDDGDDNPAKHGKIHSLIAVNNTFNENGAAFGGAIYVHTNASLQLYNNILWNDFATTSGAELYVDGGGTYYLNDYMTGQDETFWSDYVDFTYNYKGVNTPILLIHNAIDGGLPTGSTTYEVWGNDGNLLTAVSSDTNDPILVDWVTQGRWTEGEHTGKVTPDFADMGLYDSEWAQDIAVQADGKIIVVGTSKLGGHDDDTADNNFHIERYNLDGSLDTTFGTGGIVTTDIILDDYAYSLAIQADGKIVVVGTASGYLAITRYNSDGSLDTSFDGDSGTGNGVVTNYLGSSSTAYDVAIQADGKIVIAGEAGNDILLARFNTDGTLDAGFNTNGYTNVDFYGFADVAYAIAIQNDGKIVVTGSATNASGNTDVITMRYNTNGTLDNTFNTYGVVVTGLNQSNGIADDTDDVGFDLVIQDNGMIVVVGRTLDWAEIPFEIDSENFYEYDTAYEIVDADYLLIRLDVDGSLDTAFGGDGIVTTNLVAASSAAASPNSVDTAYAVALDSNGDIVVSGTNGYDISLVRYNAADGSIDTSFGSGGTGIVSTDMTAGSLDAGYGLVIQSADVDGDGDNEEVITVAGLSQDHLDLYDAAYDITSGYSVMTEGLSMVRYNMDGSLDLNFGDSGTNADYDPTTGMTTITFEPETRRYQDYSYISQFDERIYRYHKDAMEGADASELIYDGGIYYGRPTFPLFAPWTAVDEFNLDLTAPIDRSGWVENEFVGLFLRPNSGSFLDADNASTEFQQYYVISNTENSITVMGDVTGLANLSDQGNYWTINDPHLRSGGGVGSGAFAYNYDTEQNENIVLLKDYADVDDNGQTDTQEVPWDVEGRFRLTRGFMDLRGLRGTEHQENAPLDMGAYQGAEARPSNYQYESDGTQMEETRVSRNPIDISLQDIEGNEITNLYVPENARKGYIVASSITGTDPDGDAIYFSLADDLDVNDYAGFRFRVMSYDAGQTWQLEVDQQYYHDLNYERTPYVDITLAATDQTGYTYYEDFRITVIDDTTEYAPTGYTITDPIHIMYDDDGEEIGFTEEEILDAFYITENADDTHDYDLGETEDGHNDYTYFDGTQLEASDLDAPFRIFVDDEWVWSNENDWIHYEFLVTGEDASGNTVTHPFYAFDVSNIYEGDPGDSHYAQIYYGVTRFASANLSYEDTNIFYLTTDSFDAEGRHYQNEVPIDIQDSNDRPTGININSEADGLDYMLESVVGGPSFEVDENTPGSIIGTLFMDGDTDEDLMDGNDNPWLEPGRDSHIFQIKTGESSGGEDLWGTTDGTFEIALVNGEYVLKLVDGVSLDYELGESFTVYVRTVDNAGGEWGDDTQSFPVAVNISVVDKNDAPVITGDGADMTNITEDETANAGDLVSDLIDGFITDQDFNSSYGIAIYSLEVPDGTTSGTGTWQYSLASGGGWVNIADPSVYSETNALLLGSDDSIRFMPDAENGFAADEATFSYYAWDQSTGTIGNTADVSDAVRLATPVGDQPAFSAVGSSATITVSDVNDAPVVTDPGDLTFRAVFASDTGTPLGNTVAEMLASGSGDPISDVDIGATEGIAITGFTNANGTWQYNIGGGWQDFAGAYTDNSALLLTLDAKVRFNPDNTGFGNETITFRAWDTTDGNSSGDTANVSVNGTTTAYSTNPAGSATLSVLEANVAPGVDNTGDMALDLIVEDITIAANTGTTIDTIIDSSAANAGNAITDGNAASVEGIAIIDVDNTYGQWQYTIDGGTTWYSIVTGAAGAGEVQVADTSALLLAANHANTKLRFLPDADHANYGVTMTDGITFRAWDQTSRDSNENFHATGTTGIDITNDFGTGGTTAFSAATETAQIKVTPVNDAPTDVSAVIVDPVQEHNSTGLGTEGAGFSTNDVVATLSSIDVDNVAGTNDSWTYSIVGGDPLGVFKIVGDEIQVADENLLDVETADAYNLVIRVTDSNAETADKTILVAITGISEFTPTGIAITGSGLPENTAGAVAGTLLALDQDVNENYVYTLIDDASGLFEVVGNQLKLRSGVSLDYETAEQFSYTVTVNVADAGGLNVSRTVTFDLQDIYEADVPYLPGQATPPAAPGAPAPEFGMPSGTPAGSSFGAGGGIGDAAGSESFFAAQAAAYTESSLFEYSESVANDFSEVMDSLEGLMELDIPEFTGLFQEAFGSMTYSMETLRDAYIAVEISSELPDAAEFRPFIHECVNAQGELMSAVMNLGRLTRLAAEPGFTMNDAFRLELMEAMSLLGNAQTNLAAAIEALQDSINEAHPDGAQVIPNTEIEQANNESNETDGSDHEAA